jgi:hypothetical protein
MLPMYNYMGLGKTALMNPRIKRKFMISIIRLLLSTIKKQTVKIAQYIIIVKGIVGE